MRRKLLSALLVLCMVVSMLPMSALAADVTPSEANIETFTVGGQSITSLGDGTTGDTSSPYTASVELEESALASVTVNLKMSEEDSAAAKWAILESATVQDSDFTSGTSFTGTTGDLTGTVTGLTGQNYLGIQLDPENNQNYKYFVITVTKKAAPEAKLTELKVNETDVTGELTAGGVISNPTEVTATLEAGAQNYTIKATFDGTAKYGDDVDTVKTSGTDLTSGTASGSITATEGANVIYIVVANGSADSYYKLTVTVPAAAKEVSLNAVPASVQAKTDVTSIKLTATGGTFKTLTDNNDSYFSLDGDQKGTLNITGVDASSTTATVSLEGQADAEGSFTIKVSKDAFEPTAKEDVSVEITVTAAQTQTQTEAPKIKDATESATVECKEGNTEAVIELTNSYTGDVTVNVYQDSSGSKGEKATDVEGEYADGKITLTFSKALTAETTYWIAVTEDSKEESTAVKVTVKLHQEKTAKPTVPGEVEKVVAEQGNETAEVTVENDEEYTGSIEVKVYESDEGETEATGVTGKYDNGTLTLTFDPALKAETTYYIEFTEGEKAASDLAALTVQPVTTTPTTSSAEVTSSDNKAFEVTVSNSTDYEGGTVAVNVYKDADAQTQATGVTGAYADGKLTLTFSSAITTNQKVYVTFTYTPTDGAEWAASGTLEVTAKFQAKTDKPEFGGEETTTVTCEKGNTKAVINVTNNYPEGSTVKVYPADSMEQVATGVTGTYENKQITLTFDPALTAETTYQITVTEKDMLESDPLSVTVKLYVAGSDANITAVTDGEGVAAELNNAEEATGESYDSPIPYQFNIETDGTKPTTVKLTVNPLAGVKYVNTADEISSAEEINQEGTNQDGTVTISVDFGNKQYLYVEVTAENGTTKQYYVITVYEVPVKAGDADTTLALGNQEDSSALSDLIDTKLETDSQTIMDQAILNDVAENDAVKDQIQDEGTYDEAQSNPDTVWGKLYTASEGNVENGTITYYYVPFLDIQVPADGYDADAKTLTMDITPKYTVIATTASSFEEAKTADDTENPSEVNAVTLTSEPVTVQVENVTIEIVIPTDIASDGSKVYIQHANDPQQEVEVTSGKASITVPSFSTFKISAEADGPAIVNGTVYSSVQDAINAVKKDGTVTLTEKATEADLEGLTVPTALANNDSFTISAGTNTGLESAVKALTLKASKANGQQYTAANDGNGKFTIEAKQLYNLKIENGSNGKVTADAEQYAQGETVTLTVASGTLQSLTVMGPGTITTDPESVTGSTKTITFTMPNHDVTVTAAFTSGGNNNGGGSGSGGSSSGGSGSSATVTTPSAKNGSFTVSDKNAKAGDTVKVTPKANTGYVVDQVTVTDKNGKAVTVKDNGDGTFSFVMPEKKAQPVKVNVTFKAETKTSTFTDVPADAYYADAVAWAVEKGITNGTGATTFSPEASCTRAQIVTFLWRAAGSPEPTGSANPFTDVDANSYYGKAVLWAIEKGITNGTSATTFSPEATCTRAQAVTFLYRYEGTPAASGSSFGDVASDAYYAGAVAWAVREEITNGTGANTFSPDITCTRGQIVTFLYRDMA